MVSVFSNKKFPGVNKSDGEKWNYAKPGISFATCISI